MLLTTLDIIKQALREIGAIAKQEDPSPDEAQDALKTIQLMLSSWAINKNILRSIVQNTTTLSAATRTYTITGASKPLRIDSAFVRDSDNYDHPVAVINAQEYDSLTDKLVATNIPDRIFYDPGATQQALHTGTIYVYPIPDATYTLYHRDQVIFTNPTGLTFDTGDITFEDIYSEAIIYNLAVRLYHHYHKHDTPVPAFLLEFAADSLDAIKRLNSSIPIADLSEVGSSSSGFNINTGE